MLKRNQKLVLSCLMALGFSTATQAGMIVSGIDNDYHAVRGAGDPGGNQYNLLLNQVNFLTGGNSADSFITAAGIGGNFGNRELDDVFSSGDLAGSVDRITETAFNALSTAALLSTYDLLLFTWNSSTSLNADWATVIKPYLDGGGHVIWEDENNLGDLSAVITGSESNGSFGTGYQVSNVPGLTDGISGNFVNHHIGLTSWDPMFTSFITGPASDTYASRGIYYNYVPEPETLALFGFGLIGLGLSRKRKITRLAN
ncbi:PEP-CTERM sorting domain-containing protein [Photobacterium minamisatsumaniensis]|uniref:PEP-CTERM sorting domain-containing protein n=1 Tax=Photobacterium minamisatsumaniensis TaxID=2910233 RepID=UPI003D14EA87